MIKVLPGVQNQEKVSSYLAEEVSSSQYTLCLLGNQSIYSVTSTYQEGISKKEDELTEKIIEYFTILSPEKVDAENKTAVYNEYFVDVKPYKNAEFQEKADTLKEPPYVYYGSWWKNDLYLNLGWNVYDSENLIPSFYLYDKSEQYWSWGWDTNNTWDFYKNNVEPYQFYALNEDAAKEKNEKEQEADNAVGVIWDFANKQVKEGATRQQYNEALGIVNTLAYEWKKQELQGVLETINTALAAKEEQEQKEKQAAADAEAASAAASAAAKAAVENNQNNVEQYSDPGDTLDYEGFSDPGDYGEYYDDYYEDYYGDYYGRGDVFW